jgi:uncharacterized protein YcnI
MRLGRRLLALTAGALLLAPAAAWAHAEVSPAVSLSGKGQLYSLAVPTEKEGAATTTVELTVPSGFAIDSFVPSRGWHRQLQQTGSGESAVVQKVTWTGGHVPTGEDALFQFLATPSASKTYMFTVRQTYSDGSVANWSGPESSDSPAPTIEVKSSLGGGGGGNSTLTIIAFVVAAAALLVAVLALLAGGRGSVGGRPLA